MPNPFVHLHVHTHYSLLDGACRIGDIVKRAKALGMDSLAITDHGCMFGVIEFFNECKKEGIKPILGMEAYMAPGDRRDRHAVDGESAFHLLLLSQSLEGYRNLIKLSSIAYREGFYRKARIDKEILKELSAGLIATSACLGGEIPSALMKRDTRAAKTVAETYLEIFGPDRFFIELQVQGLKEQDMVNPELAELAKKVGCGTVATNDVHFLTKEDHFAHDVLCCINMGKQVAEEGRLKYPEHLYLKSPAEMSDAGRALTSWPEAMENTARIARMCDVSLDFTRRYSPVYRVPTEKLQPAIIERINAALPAATRGDDELYLRQLCEEGLTWRYGTTDPGPAVRQRLEKELLTIAGKNFCSYFLIVWDFCNYARDNGIPVGARGSGVGTMVGYLLGLCNVDPIKYGLLFERFMDPSRNEMPDIDIDICQDGRQKVIDYVRKKYGHVAQIITFGTLAAKAVCKDVGRVLGVPLSEVDRITKLIPTAPPGITLSTALEKSPELKALYKADPKVMQIIDIGKRLEGLARNAGCHAAGVIIADQPLENVVPLYKDSDDNILTQFEGPIAEKCGLLKMDFLGLRTLTVLTRAVELVKRTKGIDVDIEKLDLADRKVLDLFCRGETKGIFQFESGGMQNLLMKMHPDRLEDLIAANALFRPGPMELIDFYCNRKHGREKVPAVHPIMDNLLAETYGIMVYQEQVMQIFNQLGGIELSAAYKLIKAISKKTKEVIAKYMPEFIKGCMEKGISKEKAIEIFELIEKFGGYGFNKSHSTRYAVVAFQTAYLKTYHPVEYMAAVLTFEMGSTDKMVEYIEECRRMSTAEGVKGIRVLPADVNISDKDFTPLYVAPEDLESPDAKKKKPGKRQAARSTAPVGVIRFGLMAIRGVGEKAVEGIITQRKTGPFSSLYEFTDRVDLRQVSRSTIEALIKCGAFSSTRARRSQLLNILDSAFEAGQRSQQDKRSGQLNMFGFASSPTATPMAMPLPDVPELPDAELLKYEKELLGFYITSHPLTEHQAAMGDFGTATTKEATLMNDGAEVTVGGMISRIRKIVTRNGKSAGQQMAIIGIEDLEGTIEGTLFAETLAEVNQKFPGVIANESIVFVRGKVDRKRETPSILVNMVLPISQASSRLTTAVALKLDPTRHPTDVGPKIDAVIKRHKGNVELFLQVTTPERKIFLRADRERFVKPSAALKDELEQLLGAGTVHLCGPGTLRQKRAAHAEAQQALFETEALEAPSDVKAEPAEPLEFDEDSMLEPAGAFDS